MDLQKTLRTIVSIIEIQKYVQVSSLNLLLKLEYQFALYANRMCMLFPTVLIYRYFHLSVHK